VSQQPAYYLSQRHFDRILRWLAYGLPPQPTPIEDITPRIRRTISFLQKWRPFDPPLGDTLLSALWDRGLITVWARRDDPLNPLTLLDASRTMRREIEFSSNGSLFIRPPSLLLQPRPVQVIGYDAHVQRSLELWPLLPSESLAIPLPEVPTTAKPTAPVARQPPAAGKTAAGDPTKPAPVSTAERDANDRALYAASLTEREIDPVKAKAPPSFRAEWKELRGRLSRQRLEAVYTHVWHPQK
jgi:hypothetical protein